MKTDWRRTCLHHSRGRRLTRCRITDRCFYWISVGFAVLVLLPLGYIVLQMAIPVIPYMNVDCWDSLVTPNWDTTHNTLRHRS